MNRNTALAFVLATAAAGALADDITIESTPFVSTLSRAQVMEELRQYRQSGIDPTLIEYGPPTIAVKSDRTRAEVTAEYLASRGAVAAFSGEDSGSMYLARRELPMQVRPRFAALTE